MQFAIWLESKEQSQVLCHIAGPPASGKTTLVDIINRNHKNVIAKDIDDFDIAAKAIKGWLGKEKDLTTEQFHELHKLRVKLYRDFLKEAGKPVVLAGIHIEDDTKYPIPNSAKKFILDVNPDIIAERQYERGKKGDWQFSGKKSDIPKMVIAAQKEIEDLIKLGYSLRKQNEILGWINQAERQNQRSSK